MLKVLIIGGGGREHALGWKIKQSKHCDKLFFAPGNGGTPTLGENISIDPHDHKAVVSFCKQNNVELVVVGPDDFLAEGLVDNLTASGVKAFGPTKAAAKIEWSKSFAKELMKKHSIPTAAYETFDSSEKAIEYANTAKFPLVIKADGLALGKGVVIAENFSDAEKAIREMMEEGIHGSSGRTVVIEEYLVGREISTHFFCDGTNAIAFPSSADHKRIFDGDKGPNTGGMGVVAPLPWITSEVEIVREKIVEPLLKALSNEGTPFKGLLYPGIMVTKDGPKVIEFNARFGDPETESYMRLLKSDLVEIMLACIDGTLEKAKIEWEKGAAATVVLASGGYPGSYQKEIPIKGLENLDKDEIVFHAGTKIKNGKLVTSGGRVLDITATGKSLEEALKKAYGTVNKINFDGIQYRKDIGQKSLK